MNKVIATGEWETTYDEDGKEVSKEIKKKRGHVETYLKRARRGWRGMTSTDKLEKGTAVLGSLSSGISKFVSVNGEDKLKDAGMIVSGVLDIVGAATEFLPPPASLVTGVFSNVLSFFGLGQ